MDELSNTTTGQELPVKKRGFSCGACFTIAVLSAALLLIGTVATGVALDALPRATKVSNAFFSGLISDPVAGPLAATTDFYKDMISHDYALAYSNLAPKMAGNYSVQSLQSDWRSLESGAGILTLDYRSAYVLTGDENNSHALVELRTSRGRKYKINLVLTKFSDGWKIVTAQPDLLPTP